ncbi:MAG: lysophospholipid acyltransferase family protein [Candidatus Omnitrophica bacterium]|nr:lysophospholipid acyltransferase family protein [Candidatus Omnitrophota bacterium]
MKGRYFYYVLGEKLARVLPKPAAFFLAGFFSRWYACWAVGDLEAAASNLKAVMPDVSSGELRRLAGKIIRAFSYYLTDLFYSYRLSPDFIRRNVTIHGRERLDEALSGGKGAILASAHVGNWEMGGMTLTEMGYPVHVIALRHQDPKVDKIFCDRRARHGLKIIRVGESLRPCYEVLERNEVLAFNADRLFGREGIPVLFFGREVLFPKGLSRFGLKTGAPVLPVFFTALGSGRYLLDIGEPFLSSDELDLTQQFASRLEEKIKQFPCQWFIFQRFWEVPEWPA